MWWSTKILPCCLKKQQTSQTPSCVPLKTISIPPTQGDDEFSLTGKQKVCLINWMKHISHSYEWKWCHVCGDCFIRDNWILIISRMSLDSSRVHTNSREVLSVGEPKPRGHIQQDLFLLWKVFSMERHTHERGTKTAKPTSHSPSQGTLLPTVCRPREAQSGWGTQQYCYAQSTSFPPQNSCNQLKGTMATGKLWSSKPSFCPLPPPSCPHDMSPQLPYGNFLHENIPESTEMARQKHGS